MAEPKPKQKTETNSSAAAAAAAAAVAADDLRKVFDRFDANGDGKISASEMGGVLDALGSAVSGEELGRMMAEMDADGDGFVDLKEFRDFLGGEEGEEDDGLMDAFKMYDLDGNGRISVKELHAVMRKMGMKCSLRECGKMIRNVDVDGDGCVDFQEFKRMMTRSA